MSSPATPKKRPSADEPELEYRLEPEEDPGKRLYSAFIRELLRRVEDPEYSKTMTAAELELVRKVASDNSLTIASIRRGDFGDTARRVAEEFPFPEGPQVVQ